LTRRRNTRKEVPVAERAHFQGGIFEGGERGTVKKKGKGRGKKKNDWDIQSQENHGTRKLPKELVAAEKERVKNRMPWAWGGGGDSAGEKQNQKRASEEKGRKSRLIWAGSLEAYRETVAEEPKE